MTEQDTFYVNLGGMVFLLPILVLALIFGGAKGVLIGTLVFSVFMLFLYWVKSRKEKKLKKGVE